MANWPSKQVNMTHIWELFLTLKVVMNGNKQSQFYHPEQMTSLAAYSAGTFLQYNNNSVKLHSLPEAGHSEGSAVKPSLLPHCIV